MTLKAKFVLSGAVVRRNIRPILITLAAVIIEYLFTWLDYVTLTVSVSLILIFSIFKLDARIIIAYAILLLLITGISTYLEAEPLTVEQMGVISYWLLVSGIFSIIIERYRNRKNSQEVIAR